MRLDESLDALSGAGAVHADTAGGTVEVDVIDVDRLGVRVRGVTVRRTAPVDVVEEAARLPDALRALPERIEPVEVSRALGGARLRTAPKEIRDREYFEVDVQPDSTTVRRKGVRDGEKEPLDWTMTREQLERLVRQLDG